MNHNLKREPEQRVYTRNYSVFIPVATVSLTNMREHWAVRHRRAKEHRTAAFLAVMSLVPKRNKSDAHQYCVRMTRLGRKLDDDNLRSALKSVRDGIAEALDVDDGSPRIEWEYLQRPIGDGQAGVAIAISTVGP